MAKKFFLFNIFLFSVFFCASITARAQDSSTVDVRHFSGKNLEQYKSQQEFQYEDEPKEQMGIMDIIGYYIGKLIRQLLGVRGEMTMWRVIFYALMAIALVFIVVNLLGLDVRGVFGREARSTIDYSIQEENIREMNLDDLIADAVARGEWKLSVRLHYLKALRMLTDRELIRWEQGKTNMDYWYELRSEDLKTNFLNVTNAFENAWYGNAEVNRQNYEQSKPEFENFYSKILNS